MNFHVWLTSSPHLESMHKIKLLSHINFLLLYMSSFHGHSSQARPTNSSDSNSSNDQSKPDLNSSKFLPSKDVLGKCSSGDTFCEQISDYPSDLIKKVIEDESGDLEPFGNDFMDENLHGRMGDDEYDEDTKSEDSQSDFDEFPMCPSYERIVYPKVGKTKNKDLLFIINREDFLQGIRVETCVHKRKQCAFTETVPWGYKTYCQQKYVYKRLVALNDKGKAQPDIFLFPSCCVCIIRLDRGLSSRTNLRRRL